MSALNFDGGPQKQNVGVAFTGGPGKFTKEDKALSDVQYYDADSPEQIEKIKKMRDEFGKSLKKEDETAGLQMDAGYYFCVYFPNRYLKDEFFAAHGLASLAVLDPTFLDGPAFETAIRRWAKKQAEKSYDKEGGE